MSGHREQLPSRALLWLMVGFGLLVLPQWDRLPPWLIAVCGLLAAWRWFAQQGSIRLPGRLLRFGVMLATTAVYLATVQGRFSVDTASSFFVLAVGLKWLETRSSRDFYVLFFILIYLAAINFLFQQGIGWTLVNLAGVVVVFIGLQVLNAPDLKGASMAGSRRLGMMLLKTAPIVVLLFVFFPRMEPLWSVPLASGKARTGISDTMTPGSISDLAQSSERAFRATFGSEIPAHPDRYWRGLILDELDGDTWRQSQQPPFERLARVDLDPGVSELKSNEYEILMDPTSQRWVFALSDSVPVSDNIVPAPGDLFRLQRPADTTVRYRLALAGDGASDTGGLSPEERRRFLQLPSSGNRRTRALADTLRQASSGPAELISRFLNRLNTGDYYYTLRPPAMPVNGIDSLLFDDRRGFCAHYAGAMTFLLRAAGIPSRVVVGYQGGSPGADNEYLIVRQYDAHAWVEAWLPGSGWVRVDPTGAIAPERIESGLREAMEEEGSFLENEWASAQRYGDIALVHWASLKLDQLNYQWSRWVVGYQGQSQMDLMSRLPGNFSLRQLGYVTAGLIAAALLVAGLITLVRQGRGRSSDPVQRMIGRWHRLLQRYDVEPRSGETPDQLASRAGQAHPAAGKPLQAFAAMVNNHYYKPSRSGKRPDADRMRRLLRATRQALQKQNNPGRASQKGAGKNHS
ncbi:DUF3488 and DUF4129 domain-containing transglutaminase family protein [Marinobacter sp.]|uniref:transglutaminase TgpA family protein n=1 Tax=Marinobacter sp. TaxID=50741 RepID=UPI00384A911E